MALRALIVDDEMILADNLAKTLRSVGIEADASYDAAHGRANMSNRAYDLACVDINLGDGDGLDLVADMRGEQPGLPIIVMTGRDTESNRARAEALGANGFLAKPFALNRFQEMCRYLGQVENDSALTDEASGPTVMMYSHDSIGLGHVRRNSNIARRLVRDVPDASVLMLVGCPSGVLFDLPPGVDFIKLPSIVKTSRNVWQPGKLRISCQKTRDLRSGVLLRAVEQFKPNIFLADHVPAGVWGELLPALKAMRSSSNPPRVVLGFRDILDNSAKVLQGWDRDGLTEIIATYYDDILVYGDENIFDSVEAYRLNHLKPGATHYCGYVISDEASKPESITLPVPTAPLLVTAGGGSDAYPMMLQCLEALTVIPQHERPESLFIIGPLMEEEFRRDIEQRAVTLNARVVQSVPSALPYVAAAQAVITMGGYNTLVEAVHFNKPTIVIPRLGPSAEQMTRTRRFSELGLVRCLLPEEAKPGRLSEAIRLCLSLKPEIASRLDTSGTQRAAGFLAGELKRRQSTSARAMLREAV